MKRNRWRLAPNITVCINSKGTDVCDTEDGKGNFDIFNMMDQNLDCYEQKLFSEINEEPYKMGVLDDYVMGYEDIYFLKGQLNKLW